MLSDFWADKRPAGVSEKAAELPYDSLGEMLNEAMTDYADAPAFTGVGHTLTFREMDQYSRQFCSWIQNHTDLKPGDRIAIQLPNLLQYPIAAYGALRAGLVIVNTNPLYTARELKHQLNDSGAKALLFFENFGHLVEQVVAETQVQYLIRTAIADMLPAPKRWLINGMVRHVKKMVLPFSLPQAVTLRDALKMGEKAPVGPWAKRTTEDLAVLQYTGGTTGVAKGAMLTHGNLLGNMSQVSASLAQPDDQGEAWLKPGKEIAIAPLPVYHIYAFLVNLLYLPHTGQHNVLIANPRDPGLFIKAMKPWKFSMFTGLNTLFVSLMDHPEFDKVDFSGLKLTMSGGTALKKEVARRWKKITGCKISEGYGLTETSPVICVNPPSDPQLGTVGLPVPSTDVKVIDENGVEQPIGTRGELCARGPQVMKGYWGKVDATAEVLDDEGWFRTGDIARIEDNGFVRIVDRIKDMILVSGFNVYPNEIEDVVAEHPGVVNCACIGVPDDRTGEAARLYVIAADTGLTDNEIMEWCRERLTAYKVPRQIEFRQELPMTPVGKVLRKDLKAEYMSRQSAA